jgi:uncharacterized membrane protein SirB2
MELLRKRSDMDHIFSEFGLLWFGYTTETTFWNTDKILCVLLFIYVGILIFISVHHRLFKS